MTIRKGADWGAVGVVPDDLVVVRSNGDLFDLLNSADPPTAVGLRGGDRAGGMSDRDRRSGSSGGGRAGSKLVDREVASGEDNMAGGRPVFTELEGAGCVLGPEFAELSVASGDRIGATRDPIATQRLVEARVAAELVHRVLATFAGGLAPQDNAVVDNSANKDNMLMKASNTLGRVRQSACMSALVSASGPTASGSRASLSP